MKIILVDDEKNALYDLEKIVQSVCPDSLITCFRDSDDALAYLGSEQADVAFLDIEMPGISGLELARQIKELQPNTNIIFVTGFSQYAVDAFSVRASGYLLKPASAENVKRELDNLRNPMVPSGQKRLNVHTFGNFEVFFGGVPLSFGRGKAKELFAYLVDRRGAGCTTAELCSILWEDREYSLSLQKQFQTIVSDLLKTLRQAGEEDVLIKRRNFFSVDPSKIDCDYYRFLNGEAAAVNSYTGEYMTNYSWAEFTTGFLAGRRTPIRPSNSD